LSFLSLDGLALAQAAAVLGGPSDLAALAAVSALPDDRLFAAIEQLLEQQLSRRDEAGDYVIEHELLTSLLLDRLAPDARAGLHRRALDWLEAALAGAPLAGVPL